MKIGHKLAELKASEDKEASKGKTKALRNKDRLQK